MMEAILANSAASGVTGRTSRGLSPLALILSCSRKSSSGVADSPDATLIRAVCIDTTIDATEKKARDAMVASRRARRSSDDDEGMIVVDETLVCLFVCFSQ